MVSSAELIEDQDNDGVSRITDWKRSVSLTLFNDYCYLGPLNTSKVMIANVWAALKKRAPCFTRNMGSK